MNIIKKDKYIKCNDLIENANELYIKLGKKKEELNILDYYYIEDMNKYINNWEYYKEHQIKQYIYDLNDYINL